jgi:hypothetical protein
MSFGETLRNGLKFVLMSMGISSPAKKTATAPPTIERKH